MYTNNSFFIVIICVTFHMIFVVLIFQFLFLTRFSSPYLCSLSFCICTRMAFRKNKDILFQLFLCLNMRMTITSSETDIFCLKSIKNSLEDPFNKLQSWKFTNQTEDDFVCKFDGVECWVSYAKVKNLRLSNKGLKGQFPRAIQNCSSLTGLDFSFNELSGPIPSDISSILVFVVSFDLSNNKFTGEIPASLANCSYLNTLKLNNNMLSGEIPRLLGTLDRIKEISFANNYLSGPVPVFTAGEVDSNYANNSELCGEPLRPCSLRHNKPNHFLQSFKSGLIVGYVFSLTCSVMLTCIFYSKCVQSKKKEKNNHVNKANELGNYICSIVSRRTRVLVNQVHEYLHPRLVHKESKEVLSSFTLFLNKSCIE